MKPTTFTTSERALLQELLRKRLESNNEHLQQNLNDKAGNRRFENFYIKPYASALEKISNHETAIYSNREKAACISCVNEHYEDFHNELQLPTAFSWLTISDKQIEVVHKLDNCEEILFKCGYYNKKEPYVSYNPELHYGNTLEAVRKLKNSDKIFLSRVGQDDFYKIAFVYDNKEYVTFELKHPVSWKDFRFTSLNGESPDVVGRRNFSMITNKPNAKELLATCEGKYYPDGVLDFMNILLN